VGFSASDNRRGLEATDLDVVQDITARRSNMFLAQGMCRRLCTSHCQTRQPIVTCQELHSLVQLGPDAATTEEGKARQIVASQLQANVQPVDSLQGSGEADAGTSATSPDELREFQRLHSGRRVAGHSADWPRSVCSLRNSLSPDTAASAADGVRRARNYTLWIQSYLTDRR